MSTWHDSLLEDNEYPNCPTSSSTEFIEPESCYPPDYREWLDSQKPTVEQLDEMTKEINKQLEAPF